jgi:hypothetical protein
MFGREQSLPGGDRIANQRRIVRVKVLVRTNGEDWINLGAAVDYVIRNDIGIFVADTKFDEMNENVKFRLTPECWYKLIIGFAVGVAPALPSSHLAYFAGHRR